MYKYSDYIDVIVAIENLITSYTIRGEHKIVEGLKMALDRALNYGDAAEILQERNNRYKKRGNSV